MDTPISAQVQALAWYEGRWLGDRGDSLIEEHWTGVAAGCLMGMFRLIKEDAVRFYELQSISQEGQGVVLRIKHFDRELKGWEEEDEAVEFDLVQLGPGTQCAWLKRSKDERKWLRCARNEDEFSAWFEKDGDDAEPVKFVYRLSK